MDIKELNSVSPLRVFEEAINGGLGRGNLRKLSTAVSDAVISVSLSLGMVLERQHVLFISQQISSSRAKA